MITKRNILYSLLLFMLFSINAHARNICGTCVWSIDDNGKLTIEPANRIRGTLDDWGETPPWHEYAKKGQVKSVEIKDGVNALTCSKMFAYCEFNTEVFTCNVNTSLVKNMAWMFCEVKGVNCLDLRYIDTSNVIDMSDMFYKSTVNSIDISNFNTSNVVYMSRMFSGCRNLKSLDISHFNTSKVLSMGGMFAHTVSLTDLNLGDIDTSHTEDIQLMFHDTVLKEIDLSSFDFSNVKYAHGMFRDSKLKFVNLSNPTTYNMVGMEDMFLNCTELESVNLSNFNTSSALSAKRMFEGCSKLSTLDLQSFELQTNDLGINEKYLPNSMYYKMFDGCTNLRKISLPRYYIPYNKLDTIHTFPFPEGTFRKVGRGTDISPKGKVFSDPKTLLKDCCNDFGGTYIAIDKIDAGTQTLSSCWGTLCYPENVTLSEGVRAYRATGINGDCIVLDEVENTVPAYTPVLLYSADGTAQELPMAYASRIEGDIHERGNLLVGCNGQYQLNEQNKYVLQKNNGNVAFYYVDPSSPITTTSFRAYLELEDDASASRKRISLGNIEELLTSISTTSQDSHDNGIYNLRGEKVTSMLKGNVYVVNGKKIMVR